MTRTLVNSWELRTYPTLMIVPGSTHTFITTPSLPCDLAWFCSSVLFAQRSPFTYYVIYNSTKDDPHPSLAENVILFWDSLWLSANYLFVFDFVLFYTDLFLFKVIVFWYFFFTIHSNIISRITRMLKYRWFSSYHRGWLEFVVCHCGLLVSHNTQQLTTLS